jgi:hypothetical protein
MQSLQLPYERINSYLWLIEVTSTASKLSADRCAVLIWCKNSCIKKNPYIYPVSSWLWTWGIQPSILPHKHHSHPLDDRVLDHHGTSTARHCPDKANHSDTIFQWSARNRGREREKKKLLVSENTEKTPRLFKSCMHQRIFFQLFFLIIFYILSNKIISINNFDIKKTW